MYVFIYLYFALDVQESKTLLSNDEVVEKFRKKIVVEHCNIIEKSFWKAHPSILEEDNR